jgi:hypothetical protein
LPGLSAAFCLAQALAQQLGSSEVLFAALRVERPTCLIVSARPGKPIVDPRRKQGGYATRYETLQSGFADRNSAENDIDIPADLVAALRAVLQSCREDELQHCDEARNQLGKPGFVSRFWVAMVDAGSRAGVYIASRI